MFSVPAFAMGLSPARAPRILTGVTVLDFSLSEFFQNWNTSRVIEVPGHRRLAAVKHVYSGAVFFRAHCGKVFMWTNPEKRCSNL